MVTAERTGERAKESKTDSLRQELLSTMQTYSKMFFVDSCLTHTQRNLQEALSFGLCLRSLLDATRQKFLPSNFLKLLNRHSKKQSRFDQG